MEDQGRIKAHLQIAPQGIRLTLSLVPPADSETWPHTRSEVYETWGAAMEEVERLSKAHPIYAVEVDDAT